MASQYTAEQNACFFSYDARALRGRIHCFIGSKLNASLPTYRFQSPGETLLPNEYEHQGTKLADVRYLKPAMDSHKLLN